MSIRRQINITPMELIIIILGSIFAVFVGMGLASLVNPTFVENILEQLIVGTVTGIVTGLVIAIVFKYAKV